MRVLQIGSDRSKRGILYPESAAGARQKAYGERLGRVDIIGFSLRTDRRAAFNISTKVRAYPTHSGSKLFYGLDALRIARKLQKPDVVSAQDPFETGLIAWFIARRFNVPLHIQVHTDFLSPEYARHSFLNRLRSMAARFVLRRATRVRVVSKHVKDEIEGRYHIRAPISVIPIFVDIDHFKYRVPEPALTERFQQFSSRVLVVSRLEPEKNVEFAIQTFAASAPLTACLIVVGEGSEMTKLERFAQLLKCRERIFFEGAQDPAAYYKVADLVLVTSRYEGYGLATIEALSAGTPVLSNDVGIAREAGAIVTSLDEFSDKLIEWFKNGPREMHLRNYPYKVFDEYVRAYCDDIAGCIADK